MTLKGRTDLPKTLRSRSAAVVAAAAILALASGTAGAVASRLITSQDIKDATIRSIDVKDEGIRSIDVRDGSIRSTDLRQAVWLELLDRDGIMYYTTPHGSADVAAGETYDLRIRCRFTDLRALGGGFEVPDGVAVLTSSPWRFGRAWRVVVHNLTDSVQNIEGYATCAQTFEPVG